MLHDNPDCVNDPDRLLTHYYAANDPASERILTFESGQYLAVAGAELRVQGGNLAQRRPFTEDTPLPVAAGVAEVSFCGVCKPLPSAVKQKTECTFEIERTPEQIVYRFADAGTGATLLEEPRPVGLARGGEPIALEFCHAFHIPKSWRGRSVAVQARLLDNGGATVDTAVRTLDISF
jgi:hypothetical protein